jgi:hypothetical protein
MRNLLLRLALLAGVVLTMGGCGEGPTHPEYRRAPDLTPGGPVLDQQAQGCVTDGVCPLDPVIVDPGECDPWESLDWCRGDCIMSVLQLDPSLQSCPGGGVEPGSGGTPPPPPDSSTVCAMSETENCEEEYSDICPQPIMGKVATALVNIAGRNHEFKFTGTFWRVNPLVGRSPAWYKMDQPALSKDSWWMAEDGKLLLVCWGRYTVVAGHRLWGGTVYVQDTDLHVVMAPGHPDF